MVQGLPATDEEKKADVKRAAMMRATLDVFV